MRTYSNPTPKTRLGFHYYPDTLHYRKEDLETWLPEWRSLGISWMTLRAPTARAIPEYFISGLLNSGIEPVLHFHLPLDFSIPRHDLRLLFETYARWGVRYITLFDRPNIRSSWPTSAWTQTDLVERFLDIYLPLASNLLKAGLTPVFPPLEPGGDYWDTAFLRAALRGMQRRGYHELIETLVLGAYAWADEKALNWGSGGPERWPSARPYFTPPGAQDQFGFRIFDWYLTIARAELGKPLPVLLLAAGARWKEEPAGKQLSLAVSEHTRRNLTLARWMFEELQEADAQDLLDLNSGVLEPVPAEVLACNFWLMAADAGSPHATDAWFQPDGSKKPIVDALRQWMDIKTNSVENLTAENDAEPGEAKRHPDRRPIRHYILLPAYEWGVNDWHLSTMQRFLKDQQATVGFSLAEAKLAHRVSLIGGIQAFPEEVAAELQAAGCTVERILADGTKIAS